VVEGFDPESSLLPINQVLSIAAAHQEIQRIKQRADLLEGLVRKHELINVLNKFEKKATDNRDEVFALVDADQLGNVDSVRPGVTRQVIEGMREGSNRLNQELDSQLNGLKKRAGVPLTEKTSTGMSRYQDTVHTDHELCIKLGAYPKEAKRIGEIRRTLLLTQIVLQEALGLVKGRGRKP
jgi:hypothetical protein